jgi:hypothetical protein
VFNDLPLQALGRRMARTKRVKHSCTDCRHTIMVTTRLGRWTLPEFRCHLCGAVNRDPRSDVREVQKYDLR